MMINSLYGITTLLVLILANFSIFRLIGLPFPNSFIYPLLISITLLYPSRFTTFKKKYLYLIFSLVLLSLLCSYQSSFFSFFFFISLILQVISSILIISTISPQTRVLYLTLFSLLNTLFCIIQLFVPSFSFPTTHSSGYLYSEHANSAIKSILNIPSLGRLPGLLDENSPMVTTCMLIIVCSCLILFRLYKSSNIHLLFSYAISCFGFKLKYIYLVYFSIFSSFLAIIFTGSKLILLLPLLFLFIFLDFYSIYNRNLITRFFLTQTVLKFFALAIPISTISFFVFLTNTSIDYLPFDLHQLPAIKYRLTFFQNYEFFSGIGIGSTTSGFLDSTNGFIIYSYAFGIFWSVLIYSFIFLCAANITRSFTFIFVLFVIVISHGSLLNFSHFMVLFAMLTLLGFKKLCYP